MDGFIDIDFDPAIPIVIGAFYSLADDVSIKSYREPLQRSIRDVVGPALVNNFDVGGIPPWQPLAPSTVAIKEKKGSDSKPLILTGALRRKAGQLNIWNIDGPEAEARLENLEGVEYGFVHQVGAVGGRGSVIPERPWASLDDNSIDKIQEVFGEWIDERLVKNLGVL